VDSKFFIEFFDVFR